MVRASTALDATARKRKKAIVLCPEQSPLALVACTTRDLQLTVSDVDRHSLQSSPDRKEDERS